MKTRMLSAIIMSLIFIPLLLIGGNWFSFGILIFSIISLKEFMDAKEKKKIIPSFIKFISYLVVIILVFIGISNNGMSFAIDYRILAAIFMLYLFPTVMYHDREKYSINDAFYLLGGIIFLGVSMSLLVIIRNKSLALFLYLLLITVITDSYAYFTGRLIGRHKLLESISPNKTLEGMIGGTIFGTFIASVYFYSVIGSSLSLVTIVLITLFLSIIGQFGDLLFSAVKRYFKIKDFSNLIPGHGGMLDRLDSLLFVILGFMFFISVI